MNFFYAHGKLLLSAEYMVMYGSRALALPLQQGQSLERVHSENRGIFAWNAYYQDHPWFSARFDPATLKVLETSDQAMAERLQEMIRACIELMPDFQQELFRWDAATRLDFSPEYGFGSSSTLTALLAEWAEVNPLDLHFMVSEDSGYDVACAVAEGPILYHLRNHSPQYQQIPFHPPFLDQLYFAWLGKKQPAASHLGQLSGKLRPAYETIRHFSQLTMAMVEAITLSDFRLIMEEHEEAVSQLLGIERVSARFDELPGSVKSLGRWGSDYVMIASEADEEFLKQYLRHRDIHMIYRYKDLVYEGTEIQPDP
jgi:mevalonate kinase